MEIIWDDCYLLGIEDIDQQHQKLVELVALTKELVHDAEVGVDCYDQIVVVLKELANYTIYHFAFEEAKLEAINYEGLIAHQMEHKIFIKKISHFMSYDLDVDQIDKLEEITFFLIDWITKHILTTDSKYVGAFKS